MKKRISLTVYIFSIILAIVIAFMSAYSVTTSMYKSKIAAYAAENPTDTAAVDTSSKLTTIVSLIKNYSYYDVSEEDLCLSMIEGYVYVENDPYAYYFDADAFKELTASNEGQSEGIGVSVIYDAANQAIQVISVIKDGPAAKAGILIGDKIVSVIDSSGTLYTVADIGYEAAVGKIKGAAGTTAKFNVVRGGDAEHPIEFSIVRAAITAQSVMYHVCETQKYGKKVGVVKITSFDLTTPTQFREAMDSLIAEGCEYYVFDVRYNPGGDLASITAVLSLLLEKDDTVIITKDREGNSETTTVNVVNYQKTSSYYSCNISEDDIGKYRSYVYGKSAVITNGSTASAAELFTASLKDYGVSVIAGTKTFGKGSMQTVISLAYYGYEGALKLTTKKYFPPISEGYDGIGIYPNVEIDLDEALKTRNIYDISDTEDNQLQAAIAAIK